MCKQFHSFCACMRPIRLTEIPVLEAVSGPLLRRRAAQCCRRQPGIAAVAGGATTGGTGYRLVSTPGLTAVAGGQLRSAAPLASASACPVRLANSQSQRGPRTSPRWFPSRLRRLYRSSTEHHFRYSPCNGRIPRYPIQRARLRCARTRFLRARGPPRTGWRGQADSHVRAGQGW